MEYISTIIVLLVIVGIVALILRNMLKEKKAGHSVLCGGSCSGCSGACMCHSQQDKKLTK